MYAPTSGTLSLYGRGFGDMDGIRCPPPRPRGRRALTVARRRQLGVCPQHDVLFPQLTVLETLEFFGIVKVAHARARRLAGGRPDPGPTLPEGRGPLVDLTTTTTTTTATLPRGDADAGGAGVARRRAWSGRR